MCMLHTYIYVTTHSTLSLEKSIKEATIKKQQYVCGILDVEAADNNLKLSFYLFRAISIFYFVFHFFFVRVFFSRLDVLCCAVLVWIRNEEKKYQEQRREASNVCERRIWFCQFMTSSEIFFSDSFFLLWMLNRNNLNWLYLFGNCCALCTQINCF